MTLDATATTDQIMERICEAINESMDRFEARTSGNRYAELIEKHREAVNKVICGDARLRREMWK